MNYLARRKHAVHIIVMIVVIAIFIGTIGVHLLSEDHKRNIKTLMSNYGGGLERTVTVYSMDGTEIQSWSGKFDVTNSENEVYFDIDGRRVIIHGGVVINEEDAK